MECYITKSVPCEMKTKSPSPKKPRSKKSPRSISFIDDENVPLAKYKSVKIEKVVTVIH